MITRCPECSTLFKVVADQLKISDGWVRCGRCDHVFDGTANLQDDSVAEAPVRASTLLPQTIAQNDIGSADFSDEAQTRSAVEAVASERLTPRPMEGEFSAAEIPAFVAEAEPETLDQDIHLRDPGSAQALAEMAKADQDLTLPDVSFVHAAQPESVRTRPGWRWGLRLSAGFLLLGLMFQVVVRERDWVAATLPETRPWLQTLCQPLACVVGPLKNIDAITVDSSSFNRIRADVYRLQVTLKNTVRTELALPSVELTLTDTRDAAVLRRVLMPKDFSSAARSIPAGADWSGTLTVSVAGAAIPSRIAGYRVLAFYY
jgi:predicted Zn finger-like uncharacterized protein